MNYSLTTVRVQSQKSLCQNCLSDRCGLFIFNKQVDQCNIVIRLACKIMLNSLFLRLGGRLMVSEFLVMRVDDQLK